MGLKRIRPSASMIVAIVALVATLAGTAYAAVTITSSSQIKGRVVGGKDLQKDSIGGQAVREKSLKGVKSRWFLLNEAGVIEAQSGDFTVLDAYATNNNVYVDTGDPLADNGLNATIALQNQVNVDGAGAVDPNASGEVSVARCQAPGVTDCAPANSKIDTALVVSPRDSDGTPTDADTRKRVYVTVTE